MKSESAIYECSVIHHRFTPKIHRFKYNVFYLWLDLDEIDQLSKKLRFFSRNKFNFFSFHDRDHLDIGAENTKENILQYLNENNVDTSKISSIKLLTFPRIFGYIFNPVCFYYAFDSDDEPICAIAEVTNTYHEQKPYLLTEFSPEKSFRLTTPKHFYVSPFSSLELNFDFTLKLPNERLMIQIDDRNKEEKVIHTSLKGSKSELTDKKIALFLIKYPLLTLRVIFLIHWHALLLWLKRLPVFGKFDNTNLQKNVLRPHRSIKS
jgi:uncharacterized protein